MNSGTHRSLIIGGSDAGISAALRIKDKVFDQMAAGTGLRGKTAAAGFDPMMVQLAVWDHKVYYPGAKQMHIRVTGDRGTGRLLGAQIVGPRDTEVSKRIDIFATALFHDMRVEELCDLDLSYTPALSSRGTRYKWWPCTGVHNETLQIHDLMKGNRF